MEPFADYLGPEILREFEATFDGRKLKVLGHYRHSLPGNWKLYHENLKDPYHATLLHTFLVTFGLLVAGNRSLMLTDKTGRHGVMASAKSDGKAVSSDTKKEMRAYKEGMTLREPRFMDFVAEFDSPWSVTMATIWPNLIVQREMNTLGIRQIVPTGPHEFIMKWTMFGFEGDDEEMTRHRLRQGNLMGPAGFLGLEDNEAIKFVQDGMQRVPDGEHLVKLDPATRSGHLRHPDLGVGHPRDVQALAPGNGTLSGGAPCTTRRTAATRPPPRRAASAPRGGDVQRAPMRRRWTSSGCPTGWRCSPTTRFYVVISRENADRGMPVGLIYCENKGMIHDRAFALGEDGDVRAALSAPHHRQPAGPRRGRRTETSGRAQTTCVMQVLFDRPDAKLHQVGVYHDVFRRVERPAQARRAPLRLRQPAGRQRAVPAGLSVGQNALSTIARQLSGVLRTWSARLWHASDRPNSDSVLGTFTDGWLQMITIILFRSADLVS